LKRNSTAAPLLQQASFSLFLDKKPKQNKNKFSFPLKKKNSLCKKPPETSMKIVPGGNKSQGKIENVFKAD